MRNASCTALVMALLAGSASADYILSPFKHGAYGVREDTVGPGGSFELDLFLDSDASDQTITAIFQVTFSSEGLVYESYDWQIPFANGTIDDDSKPPLNLLPETLSAGTLSGVGRPDGVVDIELSNATDSPTGPPPPFGTGVLVTLSLSVPSDYSGPQTVTLDVVPEEEGFFAGIVGGELVYVQTDGGASFVLNIPEPGTLSLLALGALPLIRRRKRRAST